MLYEIYETVKAYGLKSTAGLLKISTAVFYINHTTLPVKESINSIFNFVYYRITGSKLEY